MGQPLNIPTTYGLLHVTPRASVRNVTYPSRVTGDADAFAGHIYQDRNGAWYSEPVAFFRQPAGPFQSALDAAAHVLSMAYVRGGGSDGKGGLRFALPPHTGRRFSR